MNAKVIAIDGPAYVGKSQIAQSLAKTLGYTFINTGHMYRAMARRAIELNVVASDETALLKMPFDVWFVDGSTFVSHGAPAGVAHDWTKELDQVKFVEFASQIAKLPGVRERLTRIQRGYAQNDWIVMEGRDIGTEVFPDAEWKFYVDASEEIRAKRLLKMLPEAEQGKIKLEEALQRISQIDKSDRGRKIAPLRKAEDAILYDNSKSPDAETDAREILACIKAGKERAPKAFEYGIHH